MKTEEPPTPHFSDMFEELCCGDVDAVNFCYAFLSWMHSIDDFVDGDNKPDTDNIVGRQLHMMWTFTYNSFWLEHHPSLLPLIHNSAMVYLESERLAASDDIQKRMASQLTKSQYQDVFYYVGYLKGGWEHARRMATLHRGYDIDVEPIFMKGHK